MRVLLLALLLGGCATTRTVIKEVPVEVRIPVSAPCMGQRPDPVSGLRESLTRQEWDSLSTDQRENLLGAQALLHKIYGERATIAAAGCL